MKCALRCRARHSTKHLEAAFTASFTAAAGCADSKQTSGASPHAMNQDPALRRIDFGSEQPAGRPQCPACASANMQYMGPAPRAHTFAGRAIGMSDTSSSIYLCYACGLLFKWPLPSLSEYQKLYENTAPVTWAASERRNDADLVLRAVEGLGIEAGDILDVGCFEGELLRRFSDKFRKFGTEASGDAGVIARRNGVNIICTEFEKIGEIERKFDLITAVDVIEHTLNPAHFLETLLALLKPAGVLIVSTGNSDSAGWRLARNHYWYSAPAEHIAFVSENWLKHLASERGWRLVNCVRFSYYDRGQETISSLGKKVGYITEAIKLRIADQIGRRRALDENPPVWTIGEAGMFKDHMLFCLMRPA
jgi:SAM-dependent methyltransferase